MWWAEIDGRYPVVLLAEDANGEFRAMEIVPPATDDQRRGSVLLSAEQAADARQVRQAIDSPAGAAGTVRAAGAVGVEVAIGPDEGLPGPGVVRGALPRDGHIFCTWQVTLTRQSLIERAGALSPTKLDLLANALRLAGLE